MKMLVKMSWPHTQEEPGVFNYFEHKYAANMLLGPREGPSAQRVEVSGTGWWARPAGSQSPHCAFLLEGTVPGSSFKGTSKCTGPSWGHTAGLRSSRMCGWPSGPTPPWSAWRSCGWYFTISIKARWDNVTKFQPIIYQWLLQEIFLQNKNSG